MTTLAKLLARKQRLLERLQEDPGPHERDEIERQLHDRQIVAHHYGNRLVIGGKRSTRFYGAFKIKLPIESNAIIRVWRPASSPKLPPIDVDFADIILPPEKR